MDHPPYSPDLSPSDFHLFLHLKKLLGGKRFDDDDDDLKDAVQNMWKNSLKNVESDDNKTLYETLLDFFYSETVFTFWISLVKDVKYSNKNQLWNVLKDRLVAALELRNLVFQTRNTSDSTVRSTKWNEEIRVPVESITKKTLAAVMDILNFFSFPPIFLQIVIHK